MRCATVAKSAATMTKRTGSRSVVSTSTCFCAVPLEKKMSPDVGTVTSSLKK